MTTSSVPPQPLRVLYLAGLFHFEGLRIFGRSLVRHLETEKGFEVRVAGAVVSSDSPLLEGPHAGVVVTPNQLASYDVVLMEGGWNPSHNPDYRFPLAHALGYVRAGGQLVVADLHRDEVQNNGDVLEAAQELLGRLQASHDKTRYLHDEGASEGYRTRFFASQMRVTDWLEPALHGIDSLLTRGAVDLYPPDAIAASGNAASTRILVHDLFADGSGAWPWASVRSLGSGHVAVIAASITPDQLVDQCPDNAVWISNLVRLLADRSLENARWSTAPARVTRRDSLDVEALLAREEDQTLERKSSFLEPTDPSRPMPRKAVQAKVGKSIAALANTDGGHVIIGQDDDGTVLGLRGDLDTLSARLRNSDGFQLQVAEYLHSRIAPGWETLGLTFVWHTTGSGHDVAVIVVPRSTRPVYLDVDGEEKECVFVRNGTRTDKLSGSRRDEWMRSRFS